MRNKQVGLVLLFALLYGGVIPLWGQYRVSGKIVDERELPLPGATILFLRGDSLVGGGMSDEKGVFSVDRLPGDSYRFRVSQIGFKSEERDLEVRQDLRLGVICLKEETYALDEVTVTGDKRDLIDSRAGGSTFRISERLKNESHNVYQALREIPLLSVNEINRTIQTADGSSPVILVNGVLRPGALQSIDPKTIESVEVIDNPSARYLSKEGVTTVLNIRLKRQSDLSQSLSMRGLQMLNGSFGLYNGSYQLENTFLSFYLNGMFFYFHDDERARVNQTRTGSLSRYSKGKQWYNAYQLPINMGGDWVVSDKDYLSYSLAFVNNPANTRSEDDGLQERGDERAPFRYTAYSKYSYLTGNYSLFYRHTFTPDRQLELTARAGHYNTSPSGWREEVSEWRSYRTEIDMDNRRQVYSLESDYSFAGPRQIGFEIGLNAYFQKAGIKEGMSLFNYREGRQYLYAAMRGLGEGRFSYSLSLGVDVVERNSAGARKRYVSPLPSLSLGYKLHPRGSLRLSLNRQRTSPSLGYLNPLNTSTDSLYVIEGNPYLSPEVSSRAVLSFAWNRSPIYLQPTLSYIYMEDRILPYGSMDGDIYMWSYRNQGHAHRWQASLTARVNLGQYGNVNVTPFASKDRIPGMPFSGNSWGLNGNLYLSYKRVSLNAYLRYAQYAYTRISRERSSLMADLSLGWSLPKGWMVAFCLRDNMHVSRSWTVDEGYTRYSETDFKDRHWTPMLSVSYYFRNKKGAQRKKKVLNADDKDPFRLEVQ